MVTAFVLVQAHVGTGPRVGEEVAAIEGVMRADVVTGPYDVIALAEAENINELGRLVLQRIQAVDGVTRTMTCPVIHR